VFHWERKLQQQQESILERDFSCKSKLRRRSVAQQLKLDAIFKVLEGRGTKATACSTFALKLVTYSAKLLKIMQDDEPVHAQRLMDSANLSVRKLHSHQALRLF